MKLIYSDKIPAIYPQLQEKFKADWDQGVIIAYEGKIHSKEQPEAQKWIHEEQHLLRQAELGDKAWWNLYLESSQFRLEEEILAYLAEVKFIKRNIKDRELRFHLIRDIAINFASELYGSIISVDDALKILR